MNTRPPESVVVVGASAAGLSVAEGLRRAGYPGRVTLIGDEQHQPYDRPPLSKQLLAEGWGTEQVLLRRPEHIAGLDLDLRLGRRAVGLNTGDRRVTLAGGDQVGYEALVVATGVAARRLRGTEGVTGVHALRTLEDALAFRDALRSHPRLVIVGSGFIGAEAAAVARELGAEVTMVTDVPAPLADVLGSELGAMLTEIHRDHGVHIETGALVDSVATESGRATGVRLVDGRAIDADCVLVGIGAVPNTDWLAGSGVPVGNGVECDATLYAGSGVWAAGDIACWRHPRTGDPIRIEHRTNAAEQGLLVARNILAGPDNAQPFDPVPFVWSDQYDLKFQIYGRTRGAERVDIVEGSTAERRLVALYSSGGRVHGVVGLNMPRATRGYRKHVAADTPVETLLTVGIP